MEISEEDFERLKKQVRSEYDLIGEIYCPYFGEQVKFSSDGFWHLLHRGTTIKDRRRTDQYYRLKLFKLAPKLLAITKTVQEFFKQNQFVTIKENKRTEKVMKEVRYWGFIAIIDDWKIKVLVKQVDEGRKQFWSIIPNWTTRKSHEKHLRKTHSGDMEND